MEGYFVGYLPEAFTKLYQLHPVVGGLAGSPVIDCIMKTTYAGLEFGNGRAVDPVGPDLESSNQSINRFSIGLGVDSGKFQVYHALQ